MINVHLNTVKCMIGKYFFTENSKKKTKNCNTSCTALCDGGQVLTAKAVNFISRVDHQTVKALP